jgi:isopentenyl diphosphate isomerase/L-lactate dehydrogenase-like FMN-dependent dehydrogenase
LLKREFVHPILLAPVAHQQLVHPRGELETAQAAAAMHSCMISSTLSSFSLEDIASTTTADKWFQLYFQPQREVTLDLLRRAERAGYTAIVVTLDTPIQAQSLSSRRAAFAMPAECVAVNLQHYPQPQPINLQAGQSRILQGMMSEAPTWQDLEWLLAQTSLPVLVKGVLHADDARELRARGVAGLVVSNHGGRTLDGAPASLRALPAIRAAVGSDYPLLLDSGIRSGTDIFKALALGADAVLIGRLQVYALSVAGALGVAHLLKLLREELEICMALAGCATLSDIRPAALQTLQR